METPEASPALSEVQEWLKLGETVRERLLGERNEHSTAIERIDEELAKLPGGIPITPSRGSGHSTSRILTLLKTRGEKMTAAQISEHLPDIDNALLHSALHRLKKQNKVVVSGDAGSSLYWPAKA